MHPVLSASEAPLSATSTVEPGPRIVRVALAGCGVVGGELLRLLRDRSPAIERDHGLCLQVVSVLVRNAARPRAVELPASLLTTDVDAFLAAECDLVVEAIGGLDPAARIARQALALRRGFVTANKALVAAHGEELAAVARARGVPLAFEAAVAGGVPIIRALRESLPYTDVRAIRGILNGTTNFVLSRMGQGVPFAAALAEAQAKGFAEADPTRDLNGQDAADKIAILAWQAFGAHPARLRVARSGLLPHPDRIAADAAALGGQAKLVAECVRLPGGGVAASVEPVVVPGDSELARASGEENLVVVETLASGTLRFSGPGAGGGPTASAVLSDLLRAAPPVGARRAEAPPSVPDPRPYRWALSVAGGERGRAALLRAAEREGVELAGADGGRANGVSRVVTAPLPRAAAGLLARAAALAPFQPLLLRHEAQG